LKVSSPPSPSQRPSRPPDPEDILSLLTDKPSLTILKLLDEKEYSIQEIASNLDLPLSSTYRKVNKLEQLKTIKKQKLFAKLMELMNHFIRLGLMRFK
jgi:DNA-binding transcriptional ArsR family regulator